MLDRRLAYFAEVAEKGGFRAASASLRVSQPALSKAIRELEREHDVSLFDRHSRGAALTQAGRSLARRVRKMQIEARHAAAELVSIRQGRGGILRVGAGPVWSSQYLPAAVARLNRRYPNLTVEMRFGVNSVTHPMLMAGELDVCLGAIDTFSPDPASIKVHPLGSFDIVVFARAGHPLAQKPQVTLTDAVGFPWIVYQGDRVLQQKVNAQLQESLLPPLQIAVECSSILGCFNLAALDDYILCMPEPLTVDARRSGLIPLPLTVASFRIGIWCSALVETKRYVQEMIAIISAEFGK